MSTDKTPLSPHVMAGVAAVMLREAQTPGGINVPPEEAARWADLLHRFAADGFCDYERLGSLLPEDERP